MSSGRRVCVGRARAGDNEDARTILFSGRDLWRNGAFAYGGFVFAPGGLEQDGLLLKVLLSAGVYRYAAENLGGVRVIGLEWLAQVLPGWRIKRGDAEFKFYLGPEFQKQQCEAKQANEFARECCSYRHSILRVVSG